VANSSSDGVRYEVECDTSGAAQHGVIAECEWRIVDDIQAEEILTLSTPFGPRLTGRWPFVGHAVQSFVLDDSALKMRLEIHSSYGRMPAIAGYHPWFRRELYSGALTSIEFTPTRRLVAAVRGLVASEDLGERRWDDLFVELTQSPRISWPDGPMLTLESDVVVWAHFERMPVAFCIEPGTGTNDGLETEWAKVVVPDDPLTLNFTIHFR
jgi:aldose 1-epimerase